MVSRRRDDMWCPLGIAGRTTRVERYVITCVKEAIRREGTRRLDVILMM